MDDDSKIDFEIQGVQDGNDIFSKVHSKKEVDDDSKIDFEIQGIQDGNDELTEHIAIVHSKKEVYDDDSKNDFEIQGVHDGNDVFYEDEKFKDFLCNCQDNDKIEASHFCAECAENLCLMCVKAHARLKITKNHVLRKINLCNCQDERKNFATHYCGECKEALCKDCVVAHQRLKITKKHILSLFLWIKECIVFTYLYIYSKFYPVAAQISLE